MPTQSRAVVLGAGFGGLELTTILSDAFGDGIDHLCKKFLAAQAATRSKQFSSPIWNLQRSPGSLQQAVMRNGGDCSGCCRDLLARVRKRLQPAVLRSLTAAAEL